MGVRLNEDDEENNNNLDTKFTPKKNAADDDQVMSQLAAMIRGDVDKKEDNEDDTDNIKKPITPGSGNTKKHDPIEAILTGAGVEYTHMNNEVIGSSKVEKHLSRRAQQADETSAATNIHVFAGSSQSQSQHFNDNAAANNNNNNNNKNSASSLIKTETDTKAPINQQNNQLQQQPRIKYKYHPPPDVAKRQFCSMARWFGFPDATEFALVVESMTQAQRRDCLERWYGERMERLLRG